MAQEKGVQGGEREFQKKNNLLNLCIRFVCVCVCVQFCAFTRCTRSQARFSSSRLKLRIASSS